MTWMVTDYSYFLIWYMGVTCCFSIPHQLGAVLVWGSVRSFRLWLISDVPITALKMSTPPANSVIWTRWRSIHLFQFLVDFHGTVSWCRSFKNVENFPSHVPWFLWHACMCYLCDVIITRWYKFVWSNWGTFLSRECRLWPDTHFVY